MQTIYDSRKGFYKLKKLLPIFFSWCYFYAKVQIYIRVSKIKSFEEQKNHLVVDPREKFILSVREIRIRHRRKKMLSKEFLLKLLLTERNHLKFG